MTDRNGNRIFVAGPWMGEFGWELFAWQGFLRYLLQNKYMVDKSDVHIGYLLGHKALYYDLANHEVEFKDVDGEKNMWMNTKVDAKYYHGVWKKFGIDITDKSKVIFIPPGNYMDKPQIFNKLITSHNVLKYTSEGNSPIIVYHARDIYKFKKNKVNSCANWPEEHCTEVVNRLKGMGYILVAIGTVDSSLHIKGTYDCRGHDLGKTINIITHAHLVIGPTSGPMHLASLCKTPHLVWAGWNKSYDRYLKEWNPFSTKCHVILGKGEPWRKQEHWIPEVDTVIESVQSMIGDYNDCEG